MPKANRLKPIITKLNRIKMLKDAREYLVSLGAKPCEDNTGYELCLLTHAGVMKFMARQSDDTKIVSFFCKFDNAKKVSEELHGEWLDRLNQYSGKWNFHYQSETPSEAMSHFVGGLALVM